MTAKSILSKAAAVLMEDLKSLGYRRSGLQFVRKGPEVNSLIELQVRRGATSNALEFVVNFGVIVGSLSEDGAPIKPTYTDCHWGTRLAGQDGAERWWMVRATDPPEMLAQQLRAALLHDVLPVLDSKQTEAALIQLWQSGRSPGLGDAQRLLFLGLLLCRAGRIAELDEVRVELGAKAKDDFAIRALKRLMSLKC